MSGVSPDVVLYDSNSNALAVQNGVAIPGSTPALMIAGSDGTNSRYILVDSSSRQIVAGAGTAGTSVGGVLTIQGIAGGVALPVSQSGTWTVQPGNTANTTPWLITINQGGNSATVTASNALKVDGSAVTQPVSGTVTANIGTTGGLALDTTLAKLTIAQSTALGSNTQAMVGGSVTTSAPTYVTGNINPLSLMTTGALRIDNSSWLGSTAPTVGSKTSANSIPVVIASDQSAITVTATNASVSTTGAIPPGSATYIGGSVTTAAPVYTTGQMNALSLTTAGALRVDGSAVTQPISGTVTANQGTSNTLANAWATKLTDTTNGPVTVKASTVASVSTDVALVTVLRDPIITQLQGYEYSSYDPDPSSYATTPKVQVATDASHRLEVHAATTTDEGSFRDDFTGTSLLTTLSGTLSFTNGVAVINGTGTAFLSQITVGQWIKKSTDTEAQYVQVESINNDTTITTSSVYTGTTASGVTGVISNWNAVTATGGSITVASSIVSLASGVTSGQNSYIQRNGDYLPYTLLLYGNVSQRIVNQTIFVGFRDIFTSPNQRAEIQFTGTVNTQVNFVTSSNSPAVDTQTTTVTLPNAGTTATNHYYKIDLSSTQATLSIDGIIVANNNLHTPGPYDVLSVFAGTTNTGVPASSTTLNIDMFYFLNTDRVQIDDDFQGEGIGVQGSNSPGQLATVNPVLIGGVDGSNGLARSLTVGVDRTALTIGVATGVPILGMSGSFGRIAKSNRLGNLTPGYQSLLAYDAVEGTTINSWMWTQSAATMTISQATGVLVLNNNSTTTTTTYAIITSTKQFPLYNNSTLGCTFRALITQTTNAVNEIGFGNPTTNTAIVQYGAFFRINNTGQVVGVMTSQGSETVSGVLATISNTTYYTFSVFIEDEGARFVIESASGVPLLDYLFNAPLVIPYTVSFLTHIPAFARVYTTGAAGIAPTTKINSFSVWQYDINMSKPWLEQLSSTGKSSNINPTTFAQTLQLAAGAAPTTITPNNTGSTAYATLGGEYVLNGTASSENLLGVFGFQVPSPYQLNINDILLTPPVVTTALGATINIQEWCLMVASSNNPSTATGQRYPLGIFSAAASAVVGTVYNGQAINKTFTTPITVLPGQFLLVLVKLISGSAAGIYRGSIFINGYYE